VPRERPQRQQKEWPRDWWIVTKEVECTTIAFLEEPQNIEETLTCENSKEWECVMQEEYDSLMTNNAWTFPSVGNPFFANGCSKSKKVQMGKWNATRPD
jgi:hypothetical protein